MRSDVEGLNEEQTATLETALLHEARDALLFVRAQMRTAWQGSNPVAWSSSVFEPRGVSRACLPPV